MILMHRGSVRLEGVGIRLSQLHFRLHRMDHVFAFESVCLGDSPK